MEFNPFPGRLRVSAELVVDGRRLGATVVIEEQLWAEDRGRREVIARLKAHIIEALLSEINPTIRVERP